MGVQGDWFPWQVKGSALAGVEGTESLLRCGAKSHMLKKEKKW